MGLMRRYDVIVIGAGAAGLVVAIGATKAGKKVLLVENGNFGGDCTNSGCIPSKTVISNANRAYAVRELKNLGLTRSVIIIDPHKVMSHVRDVISQVKKSEDKKVLEEIGMDVEVGKATFVSKHKLKILKDHKTIIQVWGKKVVIATGATPTIPKIKGLSKTPYLTSETIFTLKKVPSSLVIVGGGPIGSELAQAYSRMGSKVSIIEKDDNLLSSDDKCASNIIEKQFNEESIGLYLSNELRYVKYADGKFSLLLKNGEKLDAEHLLFATGRKPNIYDLQLEKADIKSEAGLRVNKYCRTRQRCIFAIGDVVGPPYLTHLAEFQARAVLKTILTKGLFKGRAKPKILPRVIFTNPEVASFGLKEKKAKELFRFVKTYEICFDEIDRSITNMPDKGMIKIVTKKFSSKILGVTIVGSRAGEMIMELALAMHHKIPLRKLSKLIHPYPIYNLGIRKLADRYFLEVILPLFWKKK